jgi:hypothetical protein
MVKQEIPNLCRYGTQCTHFNMQGHCNWLHKVVGRNGKVEYTHNNPNRLQPPDIDAVLRNRFAAMLADPLKLDMLIVTMLRRFADQDDARERICAYLSSLAPPPDSKWATSDPLGKGVERLLENELDAFVDSLVKHVNKVSTMPSLDSFCEANREATPPRELPVSSMPPATPSRG